MTAATITAATTGADLLDELRQLLNRHDGASTLDDVRELADDLTAALRRTRGRMSRLTRQARPAEKPTEKPADKPAPAAEAVPTEKPAPAPSAPPAAPADKPQTATVAQPERSAAVPAQPAAEPRPHGPGVAMLAVVVVAVLSVLWFTVSARTVRARGRVAGAWRSARRRLQRGRVDAEARATR